MEAALPPPSTSSTFKEIIVISSKARNPIVLQLKRIMYFCKKIFRTIIMSGIVIQSRFEEMGICDEGLFYA